MTSTEKTTLKHFESLHAPILMNGAEVEIIRALGRQGKISRTELSNITGWSNVVLEWANLK